MAFTRTHLRGFDRDKVSLSFDASRLGPGSYRLWVDGASRTFTVR